MTIEGRPGNRGSSVAVGRFSDTTLIPIKHSFEDSGLFGRVLTMFAVGKIKRESFVRAMRAFGEEYVADVRHAAQTAGLLQRLRREHAINEERAVMVVELLESRNHATRAISATSRAHDKAVLDFADRERNACKARLDAGDITMERFNLEDERIVHAMMRELNAGGIATDTCFDVVDSGLRAVAASSFSQR